MKTYQYKSIKFEVYHHFFGLKFIARAEVNSGPSEKPSFLVIYSYTLTDEL